MSRVNSRKKLYGRIQPLHVVNSFGESSILADNVCKPSETPPPPSRSASTPAATRSAASKKNNNRKLESPPTSSASSPATSKRPRQMFKLANSSRSSASSPFATPDRSKSRSSSSCTTSPLKLQMTTSTTSFNSTSPSNSTNKQSSTKQAILLPRKGTQFTFTTATASSCKSFLCQNRSTSATSTTGPKTATKTTEELQEAHNTLVDVEGGGAEVASKCVEEEEEEESHFASESLFSELPEEKLARLNARMLQPQLLPPVVDENKQEDKEEEGEVEALQDSEVFMDVVVMEDTKLPQNFQANEGKGGATKLATTNVVVLLEAEEKRTSQEEEAPAPFNLFPTPAAKRLSGDSKMLDEMEREEEESTPTMESPIAATSPTNAAPCKQKRKRRVGWVSLSDQESDSDGDEAEVVTPSRRPSPTRRPPSLCLDSTPILMVACSKEAQRPTPEQQKHFPPSSPLSPDPLAQTPSSKENSPQSSSSVKEPSFITTTKKQSQRELSPKDNISPKPAIIAPSEQNKNKQVEQELPTPPPEHSSNNSLSSAKLVMPINGSPDPLATNDEKLEVNSLDLHFSVLPSLSPSLEDDEYEGECTLSYSQFISAEELPKQQASATKAASQHLLVPEKQLSQPSTVAAGKEDIEEGLEEEEMDAEEDILLRAASNSALEDLVDDSDETIAAEDEDEDEDEEEDNDDEEAEHGDDERVDEVVEEDGTDEEQKGENASTLTPFYFSGEVHTQMPNRKRKLNGVKLAFGDENDSSSSSSVSSSSSGQERNKKRRTKKQGPRKFIFPNAQDDGEEDDVETPTNWSSTSAIGHRDNTLFDEIEPISSDDASKKNKKRKKKNKTKRRTLELETKADADDDDLDDFQVGGKFAVKIKSHSNMNKRNGVESPRKLFSIFNRQQSNHLDAGSSEPTVPSEPLTLSEDPLIQVPVAINGKLKEYQREGVKFLYSLYKQNKGGILADDMGLGKTVQSVAFLAAIMHKNKSRPKGTNKEQKRALVVGPASVLQQWKNELEKWSRGCEGGRFKAEIYRGKDKEATLVGATNGRVEVMLISYEALRNDFDAINAIDWCCMIFDEVHRLKDRRSKLTVTCMKLNNPRRYGLTGTIMQNNLQELWTLLNWAEPHCLGSLDHVRECYINPILHGQKQDATRREIALGRRASNQFNKLIKKLICRRDKTLIKDMLPSKDDNIVFCPLSELQVAAYKRVLDSPQCKLLVQREEQCPCGSGLIRAKCCFVEDAQERGAFILHTISKLTDISNHLMLLSPNRKDKADKQQRDSEFFKMALGPDYDKFISSHNAVKDSDYCGKMRVLRSTRMLNILEAVLRKERYIYSRLDGSTPIKDRQPIIDQFNRNPNKFIFLISTKAGGLGLNLTAASIVVVFDPNWNASHDLQAQDRVYRLGQTKDTAIFRLVSAGTIEEFMYQRQIYKQQLASIAIEAKNERRYFKGVAGVKGQEGELFGIANMLRLNGDSVITNDIIERTEKLEVQFKVEKSKMTAGSSSSTTASTSSTDRGELTADAPLQALLAPGQQAHLSDDDEVDVFDKQTKSTSSTSKDIMAVLKETGVSYFHRHNDVIGESAYEKYLSELTAVELEEYERQQQEAMMHRRAMRGEFAPMTMDSTNVTVATAGGPSSSSSVSMMTARENGKKPSRSKRDKGRPRESPLALPFSSLPSPVSTSAQPHPPSHHQHLPHNSSKTSAEAPAPLFIDLVDSGGSSGV
ncbi:DNA repair and recombination protein RAD26-like [Balamuthia mandrillaris]